MPRLQALQRQLPPHTIPHSKHPTLQASPTCEVLDHQNGSCTVALLLVSDCYLHHRSHSVLMASRATCAGDLLGHGQGSVKIIRPFVGVLSWINGQEWLNYIQTCIFPPGVLGSLQQKLGDDSAGSFQPFGGVLGLLKKHQPSAFSLPTPCPLRSRVMNALRPFGTRIVIRIRMLNSY